MSILIILSLVLPLGGEEIYGGPVPVNVLRVYDGDTFYVTVPGWPAIAGQDIAVRIYGIDTPEIRGSSPAEKVKAAAAKLRLHNILFGTSGRAVEVQLIDLRRDKYFRLLASVRANGRDVAKVLLKEGHAKPYFGDTKEPWDSSPPSAGKPTKPATYSGTKAGDLLGTKPTDSGKPKACSPPPSAASSSAICAEPASASTSKCETWKKSSYKRRSKLRMTCRSGYEEIRSWRTCIPKRTYRICEPN
jgi:micrococcal nuclease